MLSLQVGCQLVSSCYLAGGKLQELTLGCHAFDQVLDVILTYQEDPSVLVQAFDTLHTLSGNGKCVFPCVTTIVPIQPKCMPISATLLMLVVSLLVVVMVIRPCENFIITISRLAMTSVVYYFTEETLNKLIDHKISQHLVLVLARYKEQDIQTATLKLLAIIPSSGMYAPLVLLVKCASFRPL